MPNNLPVVSGSGSGLPSRNSGPLTVRAGSSSSTVIDVTASSSESRQTEKRSFQGLLSNALIWFLIIVLTASLLMYSSFLSDLKAFIPTEEKIVDEHGVVHYEVTSNWDNAHVTEVGRKSMQVFTLFGSFIQKIGGYSEAAFDFISDSLSALFGAFSSPPVIDTSEIVWSDPEQLLGRSLAMRMWASLDNAPSEYSCLSRVSGHINGVSPENAAITYVSLDYLACYMQYETFWSRFIVAPTRMILHLGYRISDYVRIVSPDDLEVIKALNS